MKAKRHRKFNLFLTVLLCCALPVLLLYSCKVQKVGPISPEPLTPEQLITQYISGQIIDYDTNTGLEGAAVTFGPYSGTTDANGKFLITTQLSAGTYQLVASKANYLSIYRNAVVTLEEDFTLVFSFTMKEDNSPVSVNAATGQTIVVDQVRPGLPTDQITVVIPPGALSADTDIKITPIPFSASSQLNVADPGYNPVNSVSLEPHGTTFSTAVQITIPNLLSPASLQGGNIIIKTVDPTTGVVSVRTEANPVMSADGKYITYSALHFSNDIPTVQGQYEIFISDEQPFTTLSYPSTFDDGTDCVLDDCENEVVTRYGNVTATGYPENVLNLTRLASYGFSEENTLTLVGSTFKEHSVFTYITVARTNKEDARVRVVNTVNYKRVYVSVRDINTNVTITGVGYLVIPTATSTGIENYGEGCHDQG